MKRDDVASFRRWLIVRLKETRYSVFKDETIEELAERLGVTPEILRLAQSERAGDQRDLGLVRSARYDVSPGLRKRTLPICCPEDAYEDLRQAAARMRLTRIELTRALVHTLLSGPDNPWWLTSGWMYQGQRSLIPRQPDGKKWPWIIQVTISLGAYVALARRAERLGTTKTALIRGAIIDYLEGRLTGGYVIPVSQMWQDPDRYWTGELIREGKYHGHPGTVEPRVANQR